MRCAGFATALVALACMAGAADGEVTRADLDRLLDSAVQGWQFRLGDCTGAEAPAFDDSGWQRVDAGFEWWPHDSVCWFRKRITIPETINGLPVAGSTVRLRVAIDNEAKAYVDGEVKQQFKWGDGDFVLREKAKPGETVTVALYGVNHAGYGSLQRAYLVSSAGQDLVEALRSLVADYEVAQSYIDYGPSDGAAHWREIVHASMQQLDLAAYRAADKASFLKSVENSREVLLADRKTFEQDLQHAGDQLAHLKASLERGAAAARQMAYVRADARVIESFLQYARDDLADGKTAHAIRALTTARFLGDLCDEALEQAEAIVGDPKRDLVVPQYHTGPVATRDGAFWQDNRPVFFTGVGHFDQARKDIPILPQYGLNIIQMEMGPNSVVVGPDAVDDTPIREVVLRTLDNAAAHNVMVNLLISPHYFPKWALERFPELKECGQGFMGHCIDAPESREIYQRYLSILMPLIARHPALHSICLSNEPQYDGRCEHTRTMFHEWLTKQYGDVGEANKVYGSDFAGFDQVPFPDGDSVYALRYDYWRFNQDRFLKFHEFLAGLVHKYDPGLPVHAKVMSHAFGDPGKFEVGIDYAAFTQLGAIAGNDCTQNFAGNERGEYLQHWQDMALNYTLQHSVAPEKPIFNSEDHIIGDGDWRYIPAAHIRTAFWMQAIHGQGAATTWVWERAQEGDFRDNILTRADCVRALGHVALDLNRLAPEVHELQQVKPQVAIFYAFSSMLPSDTFTKQAAAAFEGLYFADTPCAFVTEEQAVAGDLKNYKLVVVPNASHIPAAVLDALLAYLESGGNVVAMGACNRYDEHGRPEIKTLQTSGRGGKLLIWPRQAIPARTCREYLDPLVDEVGCARPIRLEGPHGEPLWGVNLRTVEYDGKRLVNLVNYGRADQAVVLKGISPNAHAVNLFDNSEAAFPLTARPLDPILLSITSPK